MVNRFKNWKGDLFILFGAYECFACGCVCADAWASAPSELELQMIVNLSADAGN